MIERVSLFSSKKEILYFFTLSFFILLLSLSFEYYNYKKFTAFDSQLVNASVLKQYVKSKISKSGKEKTYQVLKLKSDDGLLFYTTALKELPDIKNRKIELEIWAGEISFYEYMRTFFAFSKIIEVSQDNSLKNRLIQKIELQHKSSDISMIYEALYLAKPLELTLVKQFSNLGISHLIAISGFHLGVLSGLLFFLLKYPYKFLQNRYFPYRSYKLDSFIFISCVLLFYLLFLGSPPSLLRAFVMLVIGFVLYDRGIKILSMQTLLLTVTLILVLFPRLFFSLGFWLSSSGVFYIFLFLIHFKEKSKLWQFFTLPIWVYLMMLPYSLVIFSNFSLYHPLSIIWTTLFTLFYPLSILLHLLGVGSWFDFMVNFLLTLKTQGLSIKLDLWYLVAEIILSFLAIKRKIFFYILLLFSLFIFIHSIYNVA